MSDYIVVYDPNGGFVTGGGWIWSAPGNYLDDPTLEGKANFGFVAKYKKGATIPEGNTEFKFKAGDLDFKSTAYEWLVVAGKKAKFKGDGTINGAGSYKFMLSAIDGESKSEDKFRIKIWADGGGVVYDNQPGQGDDVDASTAISGGSIQVHDGKGGKNARIAAPIEREIVTEKSIEVYPNPFQNSFNIRYSSDQPVDEVTLTVLDISGKTVFMESFIPDFRSEYSCDLSGKVLRAGIYFVHVNDGIESKIFKMKKE